MAAEFLPGNRLTLLNSGQDYFPALLAEIEAAQSEIYLESYIFADDEVGHAVAGALCRAARRGVQVNVTVDGFGSRNFSSEFMPLLTAAGVQAMQYRPEIGPFSLQAPSPAPPAPQAGGDRRPGRLRRRHQYHRRQ